MGSLPEILFWDEEAPSLFRVEYDAWEGKRILKRDAAIAILRPGGEAPASHEAAPGSTTDEKASEELISELWPA